MNKLKFLLGIIPLSLILQGASCVSTSTTRTITVQETIIIEPPATFYKCPTLTDIPNYETLTNLQLAEIIVQLDDNNGICKTNIDAIKAYVEQEKINAAEAQAKKSESITNK